MLKAVLAIMLSCAAAQAGQFAVSGPFSGLNDTDATITLAPGEAQSTLNVEVLKDALSIRKRDGYTLDSTLTITTAPVYGGIMFTDGSSRKIKLFANDRAIFASIDGGVYTAITSTFTAAAKWSFCEADGKVYAFNSAHDTPFSYNGTGLEYYESMPKGSLCAATPTRLLIAGTTDYPNRLYFSEQGNYENFTLGTTPESPSFDDIGLSGEKITMIYATDSEWLIAKTNTLISYQGTNQYDLVAYVISIRVGMVDPHAIVAHEGIVYFKATDGVIWAYASGKLTQINGKIETFTDNITKEKTQIVTYNSTTEFDTGTKSYSGTATDNVNITAGTVEPLLFSNQETSVGFANSPASVLGSSVIVTSGKLYVNNSATVTSGTFTSDWYHTDCPSPKSGLFYYTQSMPADNSATYSYRSSSSSIYSPATAWTTAVYNDIVSPSTNTYWQFRVAMVNESETERGYVSAAGFFFKAATGTWTESERFIGTVGSWGVFNATEISDGPNRWTYTIKVATFSGGTGSQSATAITTGAVITASTGTYASVTAKYTLSLATQIVRMTDLSYQYKLTPDNMSVAFEYKGDIYFSVPYGMYSYNTRILKLDTNTMGWNVFDIGLNTPIVDGENIYFGSPTGGYIYRYPSGNSDNGTAINSYWKTGDFLGSPYQEKEFSRVSTIAKSDTGSSLDVSYTIDTSTTNTFSIALTTTTQSYYRDNRQLPFTAVGTMINLQVGNNSASQPWTYYGTTIDYKDKPWRVYP